MSDSKTVTIALFILAFWLFLPLPMILFNVGGFQEVANTGNIVTIYFNLLSFNIPGADFVILRIVNFIQIVTLFVSVILVFK